MSKRIWLHIPIDKATIRLNSNGVLKKLVKRN
ncbi:unnamed protein product, partial [marine sediment metagenome]